MELANAITAAVARGIDWFHIPALDTTEDAFYAPLAKLDVGSAQVYLGLVHSMDSFSARYKVAKKYLPEFGLGAYCGLGRLQPSEVEGSFKDHQRALAIAREIAQES